MVQSPQQIEQKLLPLIEETVHVLTEIERTVFTKRYNLSKKHVEIFSLHSVAMIYSLWEGFVQKAFNILIDEINLSQIKLFEFENSSLIFHVENNFKQLYNYPLKPGQKITFFRKLDAFFKDENHKISRIVDTESNVGFKVLNKLMSTFSMKEFPECWGVSYTYPNPSLEDSLKTFLRIRNAVAHGGDILASDKVNQAEYTRFKMLITDLMYEIMNEMKFCVENRSYLVSNF
jgi:hypothetical protein